ncbi:hypothetical protein [Brevibacillus porteri]|uniref:hypothetical protein n=1 Tax=Brevibacillus porteri TaxID=2126350 RepID=UPI003D1D5EAA
MSKNLSSRKTPQKCRNRQEDMYFSVRREPGIDKSYNRRNEITEREKDRVPGRDGNWSIAGKKRFTGPKNKEPKRKDQTNHHFQKTFHAFFSLLNAFVYKDEEHRENDSIENANEASSFTRMKKEKHHTDS